MADFLFEIGCEELPADQQNTLAEQLAGNIAALLCKAGVSYQSVAPFSTPRRLAVSIKGLGLHTEEREVRKEGPFLRQAFDSVKAPTAAGLGFARSCGVSIEALQTFSTPRGERLLFVEQKAGKPVRDLLPDLITESVHALKFKKTMRWSNHTFSFIRPVRWLVALLDTEVVPITLFGCQSGLETQGHSVLAQNKKITLVHAKQYVEILRTEGKVLVDYLERKAQTLQVINEAAKEKGVPVVDTGLLEEVTGVTEWPIGLLAKFAVSALTLPKVLLITVMREHLKSFAVEAVSGELLPFFVVVTQVPAQHVAVVRSGYEKVIQARLADAQFFLNQDKATPLSARIEDLKKIIFEKKLGNLYDKAQRMVCVSAYLSERLAVSAEASAHAAWMAKCDLLSDVVTEFPILQGAMGAYYAEQEGFSSEVAQAIKEHYLPRFAEDMLPSSGMGSVVALAHHVDAFLGMLSVHGVPSGEKDPYGIRRAALAILRIVTQLTVPFSLREFLHQGIIAYPQGVLPAAILKDAYAFLRQRFSIWQQKQGYTVEQVRSVLSIEGESLECYQAAAKLAALKLFLTCPEADTLLALNKRLHNLVTHHPLPEAYTVEPALFQTEAEKQLYHALDEAEPRCQAALQSRQYLEALQSCLLVNPPITRLLECVMILDKDDAIRINRLALLSRSYILCNQIAQLSQLSL